MKANTEPGFTHLRGVFCNTAGKCWIGHIIGRWTSHISDSRKLQKACTLLCTLSFILTSSHFTPKSTAFSKVEVYALPLSHIPFEKLIFIQSFHHPSSWGWVGGSGGDSSSHAVLRRLSQQLRLTAPVIQWQGLSGPPWWCSEASRTAPGDAQETTLDWGTNPTYTFL